MHLSEIYDRAADAIEKYGHFRGDVGNRADGFCIIGALADATDGDSYLAERALDVFQESYKPSQFTLTSSFSDRSSTQVVLDTLRRAAKSERLKEESHASQ